MSRHSMLLTMGLLVALGGLGLDSAKAPAAPVGGQNPSPQAGENPPMMIKTETSLVLVDVIATNKKGEYIKDLEQKDFHVYEDDAEQTITAFSHEAEIQPNGPARQRYMVLFFDDSTMNPALQIQAREAAGKFVESTASPNRLMAVVDFDGTLKMAQNFTAEGDLLKRAISSPKYASVNPNAGGGGVQLAAMGAPSLAGTQADFAARSVLLSIRDVAKNLRDVPGRKTMILFSAGFPLTAERQSQLTATIDTLNKSNIAVYPVDVRGLTPVANPGMDISKPSMQGRPGFPPGSELRGPESPFPHFPGLLAALAAPPIPDPQRGVSGGGTAGGAGGGTAGGAGGGTAGGSGASRGGTSTGAAGNSNPGSNSSASRGNGNVNNPNNPNASRNNINNPNNPNNPNNVNCMNGGGMGGFGNINNNCANRPIIPQIPDSVSNNQQVLYALAKGTGGFEIFNTNDFLTGLEKVAKEMNEYYNLGYAPPSQTHDGSYRRIKVKLDRKDVIVRYRTGYYDIKSPDLLKGKPEGKALEERAASPQPCEIPVSLTAPYFYVEPGVARVNLALSVPGSSIDFERKKGNFHSNVNVLGIAYRANGSVAARFSDTVKLEYEKKEIKDFTKGSFSYQNAFNIAPGSYTLKLVLSSGGEKFGKYSAPLVVEPFTGDNLCLGGPALGDSFVPISQFTAKMDAALLEERTPLVFKDMELVPSPSSRFAKTAQPTVYLELYDPLLKESQPPRVGVLFDIVDRKTNQQVYSSNTILVNEFTQPGNPLVPLGFKLPIEQLQAGDYRFEIKGRDGDGNVSSVRSADFSIE